MAEQHSIRVGDVLHGFQSGAFGRDSYGCRRVEAVGSDWVVTRVLSDHSFQEAVELVTGTSLTHLSTSDACPEIDCPTSQQEVD